MAFVKYFCPRYKKSISECLELIPIDKLLKSKRKSYPPPCRYLKGDACTYPKKEGDVV